MTFWDHLEELRRTLFRCVIVAAAAGAVAFLFKEEVFAVVFAPRADHFLGGIFGNEEPVRLINTELTRQFMVHVMVSFYAGLVVTAPYIIYEAYRFVSPALYPRERRYSVPLIVSAYVMFMVGVLFSYFVIFPITYRFLAHYQVDGMVENLISIDSYIDTLVFLSLAMGIVFEMPLLSWLLGRMGVLRRQRMRMYRRHAIVVILIAAAIITPTADAFTLAIVSVPMYLLYELSILLVPSEIPTPRPTDIP